MPLLRGFDRLKVPTMGHLIEKAKASPWKGENRLDNRFLLVNYQCSQKLFKARLFRTAIKLTSD